MVGGWPKGKKRKPMSKATREKMSIVQKRRWDKYHMGKQKGWSSAFAEKISFCPKCGHNLKRQEVFNYCRYCGYKL